MSHGVVTGKQTKANKTETQTHVAEGKKPAGGGGGVSVLRVPTAGRPREDKAVGTQHEQVDSTLSGAVTLPCPTPHGGHLSSQTRPNPQKG